MQKPKGRYVKLNPVDYLLIGLFCLLALSLLVRGVFLFQDRRAEHNCTATVEFEIHGVDAATCARLQTNSDPFYLENGMKIENAQIKFRVCLESICDENGEWKSVVSDKYDVQVSFLAQGTQNGDNAFLLNGKQHLAVGDHATVSWGNREFKVEFTKVEPEKAL